VFDDDAGLVVGGLEGTFAAIEMGGQPRGAGLGRSAHQLAEIGGKLRRRPPFGTAIQDNILHAVAVDDQLLPRFEDQACAGKGFVGENSEQSAHGMNLGAAAFGTDMYGMRMSLKPIAANP